MNLSLLPRASLALTLLLAANVAMAATTAAQCGAQKGKARDACYKTFADEKCGALVQGQRPTSQQMMCRGQLMQSALDSSGFEQKIAAVKACKAKAKKASEATRCEKLMDE